MVSLVYLAIVAFAKLLKHHEVFLRVSITTDYVIDYCCFFLGLNRNLLIFAFLLCVL